MVVVVVFPSAGQLYPVAGGGFRGLHEVNKVSAKITEAKWRVFESLRLGFCGGAEDAGRSAGTLKESQKSEIWWAAGDGGDGWQ